jgi:AcrR family transcriptional regulator
MPKLTDDVLDQRKERIEKAALSCFLKRGFHGVSMREIAEEAHMSLGNAYVYYPDKLALFQSILKSLTEEFLALDGPLAVYVKDSDFPHDLEKLAASIDANVDRYTPYFKMMYIDVVEFEGKHVKGLLSNVHERFNQVLGARFKVAGKLGPDQSIDPGFAFVAVYLQFYYFFLLRRLFGAEKIYGPISDKTAVSRLIHLFQAGIGG